ncbi:hypothetical protein ASPZODRAFT_163450 [Penicilliopsis zonata CBS 506.65]|uniref:Uncharacterized protein n=1 Tax=Penicilliopsis zonata CBS 506.65 TaxID=1073090 RepID=A0A1L9SWU4_9EURO|nr:hypothetical protein ASPZODRAFT_163450 [Penicilliopsis zonata CBS 506.65]OJJ51644.1 hypothetical protein ASPZODRAFT_163450 [Penicilliopsis zonata CBS 506.65]
MNFSYSYYSVRSTQTLYGVLNYGVLLNRLSAVSFWTTLEELEAFEKTVGRTGWVSLFLQGPRPAHCPLSIPIPRRARNDDFETRFTTGGVTLWPDGRIKYNHLASMNAYDVRIHPPVPEKRLFSTPAMQAAGACPEIRFYNTEYFEWSPGARFEEEEEETNNDKSRKGDRPRCFAYLSPGTGTGEPRQKLWVRPLATLVGPRNFRDSKEG